jgi:hypothetical protein
MFTFGPAICANDMDLIDQGRPLPFPDGYGRWIRTISPATEKLPLGRAMWLPRTAAPARRGTDPEGDEKFASGFLRRRVCELSFLLSQALDGQSL